MHYYHWKSLPGPHNEVTYLFCECISFHMLESLGPGSLCSPGDGIMYLLCVPTTHYHWTLILDRGYVSEIMFRSMVVRCVGASVMDRQKSRKFENRKLGVHFGGSLGVTWGSQTIVDAFLSKFESRRRILNAAHVHTVSHLCVPHALTYTHISPTISCRFDN